MIREQKNPGKRRESSATAPSVERKLAAVSSMKHLRASVGEFKADAERPAAEKTQRESKTKARRITERLSAMLQEGLADRIAEVMRDASVGEVKLAPHQLQMIDMILDRTEGKPLQAHKIETNQVDENTARLLAELLERRLAAEEKLQ